MNARRLALVAAALGLTASQYVLWRQWLYTTRVLTEIQRREGEHRCPVVPAAVPVPAEGVFAPSPPVFDRSPSPPVFDRSPFLPVRTDPALEDSRG